jgi:hypothetical protein
LRWPLVFIICIVRSNLSSFRLNFALTLPLPPSLSAAANAVAVAQIKFWETCLLLCFKIFSSRNLSLTRPQRESSQIEKFHRPFHSVSETDNNKISPRLSARGGGEKGRRERKEKKKKRKEKKKERRKERREERRDDEDGKMG